MHAHPHTVLLPTIRLGRSMGVPVLTLRVARPVQADDLHLLIKHSTVAGHIERVGLGLRFSALWSDTWRRWHAALRPVLGVSRFRDIGSAPAPHHLDEVGALGILHLARHGEGVQPYVETGLGGALLSHVTLGEKTFSTRFQLSEHVGAAVRAHGHPWAGSSRTTPTPTSACPTMA